MNLTVSNRMKLTYRLQLFICLLFLSILSSTSLNAKKIEIRYFIPEANEVSIIWGINNWQAIRPLPPKTRIYNKVMITNMQKVNNFYSCILNVPDNAIIDYTFYFKKTSSPLRLNLDYWDLNNNKNYQSSAVGSFIIEVHPNNKLIYPKKELSLLKFSSYLLFPLVILALIFFLFNLYVNKSNKLPIKNWALFFSMILAFFSLLLIIRIYTTNFLFSFLANPFFEFPSISKAIQKDVFLVVIIGLFFTLLMKLFPKKQLLTLIILSAIIFVSIIFSIINIQLINVLGKPFNYQWLYYSDFLNSTDASSAILSNINKEFIISSILIVVAFVPLFYIFYWLINKKAWVPFLVLFICLVPGLFVKNNPTIPIYNTENPVLYFINSIYNSGNKFISESNYDSTEFINKHIDTTSATYAKAFKNSIIKNVIFFVLESTPAEYITPFNNSIKATPFLDSIQHNAALFTSIYAHVPATNKSLVSLLCGNLPYLSYKSITKEFPNIQLPSISDELKKLGYQTAFFNAGDNRFQNAEGFLKNRSFDVLQDMRNITCSSDRFSDEQFAGKNEDGINDACLSNQFLLWQQQNKSENFFAMLWTFQTHYPYYSTSQPTDFKTGNISLEKYLNALHQGDNVLQQLVNGLKKQHLLESTLIVVVGDHGEAFGRHNQSTHAAGIYEENLHVPLLFINPLLFKGERINSVGGISDITPTVLAILNKPIPLTMQGENLFSDNRRKRTYFFSPFSDFLIGFRQDSLKFILNVTAGNTELYNLNKDPNETNNIADQNKPFVIKAQVEINTWMNYQNKFMQSLINNKKQ